MPNLLGDLGSPEKDAAALQPLEQDAASRIAAAITALGPSLGDLLDGMTITITIHKKETPAS